jgi:hypothetical protein
VWSSSNTSKATVSSSGLVTAVNNSTLGNVTITATAGTKSATTTIAVIGHGTETLAALPNIFLDTTEPVAPAAGRTVITVAAGGNFQAALNAAQPGDVIELAAGATYSGNFTLPNKGTSTSWIVIRPSNYQQLPAAGQRMTPTIAAQLDLPTIQSPNSAPAIQPNTAAHHYRFTGIEVTMATAGNSVNYGLISTDANSGQNQMSQVPHDLVFDRMYIHGAPTFTLRRCVALNSAYTSIIDSDLRECHDPGQDSQAIAGWNGPGPFKIVNNYLEGATENVIFGGADPAIPNMTPSDIEIRGNHIYKPIAFKNVWAVKNLLELKHAQRVLIEGNILDGSWIQGQVGYGVVLKTVNQNGACTWCVTQDVTFRYNLVRNVGGGFNIAASPDNGFADTHARRITITDNVVSTINVAPYTGTGIGFMISDDLQDVTMAHNTLMSPTNSALQLGLGGTGYTARTVFRDNVAHGGLYSVIGDNVGTGTNAITRYMPGGVFAANVLIQTFGSAGFPAGSFYPTSPNTIGFANAGGGDFSLLSSSPYRAAGTDGRDPGVDMPGLLQRIANVIVP